MANYRIPGPLGMGHSQQPPIDPLTRQPQRIPGPLGSHCEYQLKQKLELELELELEKKEIALDICQFILDMTGIIDPTPASDSTNAIISLSRGRWIDAVISVVSIVPYVGDFAKLGKLPRYLKSIKKAIRIAQTDFHWSNALKRLFIPLKKVIDQLYELGANKLPPHASKTLRQIKREIDHFLKPASSGTTANQTVGEFIANSSKNSSPKVKQSANTPSKSKQANIEEKPKKGVSSEKESGIIDGKGGKNSAPKKINTNPENIRTAAKSWSAEKKDRFELADKFYKEAGYKDFDSHLRGIDFDKPLEVVKFSRGDKLYQYSYLDRMTGQPKVGSYYYGEKDVDIGKLGFDVDGRKMIEVKLDESGSFLKSSAANIEDWNGSDKIFPGGETQLFNPNASYSSVEIIK